MASLKQSSDFVLVQSIKIRDRKKKTKSRDQLSKRKLIVCFFFSKEMGKWMRLNFERESLLDCGELLPLTECTLHKGRQIAD